MDDNLISVIDVGRQHGKPKSTVFKVINRLGIEAVKRRSSASKNQFVSYITQDDFQRVSLELRSISTRDDESDEEDEDDFVSVDVGVLFDLPGAPVRPRPVQSRVCGKHV